MPLNEAAIVEILRRGVSGGASDVHLKVGEPPLYRVSGSLHMAPNVPPLTPDDTRQIGAILLTRAGYTFKVDQVREFDFAYSANKLGRFRVNMFRSRGSFGLVLRIIPTSPPTLEDLILPPALKELALVPRGMILVTGATGSGKSTTLAAMIDRVNRKRRCHILTIEDPIEYLHPNRNASVSQREVGTDTQNFMSAFRGALRQDPDVILVGEMRDQETMEMALKAAETGHLVLSTLHTTDTIKSINRMLAFFDAKAQNEVRQRIADTLSSIVCQRLVKRQDTEGRIAACEVLVANPTGCRPSTSTSSACTAMARCPRRLHARRRRRRPTSTATWGSSTPSASWRRRRPRWAPPPATRPPRTSPVSSAAPTWMTDGRAPGR